MIDEKSCGCIIVEGSKVLLIQHNEGHWDFPKGHVEENETEVETAIREVKEETNLDVEVYEDKRYISEYYTKKGNFKQVVYFLSKSRNNEIKRQEEEIQNIEWLPFEEALNKITYDNSREILKQVIRDINPNKKIEFWDLYDKDRKKIAKTAIRGVTNLKEGEYHIVVEGIIVNSKNEILITKRAPHKQFPLVWECNGGSIVTGETSLEGIIRELKEELGIEFSKKEGILFKTIKRDDITHDFKDLWVFKRDIEIKDITFPDKEAIEAKWVTIDEFVEMYNNKEIVPTQNYGVEDYKQVLEAKQRESYKYIGQKVQVKIDRALGTKHPKHEFEYLVNYGYVPNTVSGDGEELNCYVLGIDYPLETFEGKCIAIIHRTSDDDDKLIIVPEGEEFTDEEIRKQTNFQEQYFESEIIR